MEDKIRIEHTINDLEYERKTGLREARSKNFWGNWLIGIGIITLPIFGLGIIFLILGIYKKIQSRHLKVKYKE